MGGDSQTIRKIVNIINNEEENGGLWLPNIQRYFVWDEDKMERLFDSVMRQYPINILLFWRTKEKLKIREFIQYYHDGINITDFYIPNNENKKIVVLDGQQRLQSFYVALKGSYNKKELYFNIFSGIELKGDILYQFKFLTSAAAKLNEGWVKLKEIVYNKDDYYTISDKIIGKIKDVKNPTLIRKNIGRLKKVFSEDEIILYQELDSIDNPHLYDINDIVEVFIRANSGGTPLSKSDLMFSLLTLNWEEIEEELLDFLNILNRPGYEFTRDFILKTSLTLIETGAKYDVLKFRKEKNINNLRSEWGNIKSAISDIRDFIQNNTFMKNHKALPSYLALIPLIYYKYKFPDNWEAKKEEDLGFWLTRVMLAGAFSGSSDTILDAIIRDIKEKKDFDIDSINSIIIKQGRRVHITSETVLESRYGQKKIYLIFFMLYKTRMPSFMPASEGNLPTLDHIFPQSLLKSIKVKNPKTNRMITKYSKSERDQIANLMVLSHGENCAGKRDTPPDIWFTDKEEEYLRLHLIPHKELLEKEKFEEFIKERKKLIIEELKSSKLILIKED